MTNFNQYWALPVNERQAISEQHPEQETSQPVIPTRYTLADTFEAEVELVVCASGLFIMIVQDRGDLGGGYGLQVLALGKCVQRHFETLEDVEAWLTAKCPYVAGIAAWVPLPCYYSRMHETEIWRTFCKEAVYELAQEG